MLEKGKVEQMKAYPKSKILNLRLIMVFRSDVFEILDLVTHSLLAFFIYFLIPIFILILTRLNYSCLCIPTWFP